MKIKKGNLKKIIVLLIIFCIVILIFLINSVKEKQKFHVTELKPYTRTDRYLKLSGFGIFFEQYNGYLKSSEISGVLEKIITNKLPKIYDDVKNYSENELESYYNENITTLKSDFGINDVTTFINFIEKIKKTNVDINTWNELDVIKESFIENSQKNNYSYAEFNVIYENNSIIKYSIFVKKVHNSEPVYILDVV